MELNPNQSRIQDVLNSTDQYPQNKDTKAPQDAELDSISSVITVLSGKGGDWLEAHSSGLTPTIVISKNTSPGPYQTKVIFKAEQPDLPLKREFVQMVTFPLECIIGSICRLSFENELDDQIVMAYHWTEKLPTTRGKKTRLEWQCTVPKEELAHKFNGALFLFPWMIRRS